MRRFQIDHTTTYQYGGAVRLLPHRLLMRPREGHDVRIERAELTITPAHDVKWHRDVYDNAVAEAIFLQPCCLLSIASRVRLCHYQDRPLDFWVADYAVSFPFQYDAAERADLAPYLSSVFEQDRATLNAWTRQLWRPGQTVETYLLLDGMNKAIASGFVYRQREEPGVQTPRTTLTRRAGSCRDFATLLIEACRSLGLAARFVSGYLCTADSAEVPGSTHAWADVYLPGAGWKGFDSTSGRVVGNDHIAVAVSRYSGAVPPIAGSYLAESPQSPMMQVRVQVTELPASQSP